MKKNEITTVRISDISQTGDGIGHVTEETDAGFTVFVKDTVPGDVAQVRITRAKKNYAYGRLEKVRTPSPDRTEPLCPIARPCGGCQLQMMRYEAQCTCKRQKVVRDLERIGGIADAEQLVGPLVGMEEPFRYRNKSQFPVGADRNGNPVAGYYAGHTHVIIPCEDCLIGETENSGIIQAVLAWMQEAHIRAYYEETGRGLVRHILVRKGDATGEIIVCLVINGASVPRADFLIGCLSKIPGMTGITYSTNTARTNVILNGPVKTLWGRGFIYDDLTLEKDGRKIRYAISPASFYQVNHTMAEKLYRKALSFAALTGQENVMDLYCGIGTISLFLAPQAKHVTGVEIVPEAVADARRNAELNGIGNVDFYAGKAEEVVPDLYARTGERADVVVVDPPRKGCDALLLDTMIRMKPSRIVYVSCDPATLARDLKILGENGYELVAAQPYDLFPQTVHVEVCCSLRRRKL